jgi:hypothetical protein
MLMLSINLTFSDIDIRLCNKNDRLMLVLSINLTFSDNINISLCNKNDRD